MEVAQDSGIATADGVLVDSSLESSEEHVWAVGDCATFPSAYRREVVRLESVQNATDQARFLAKQLVSGVRGTYRAVPWFWSNQADLRFQSVGLTNDHTDTVIIGNVTGASFSVLAFQDSRLIGGDSINAPADHLALRRLFASESDEWKPLLTPEVVTAADFRLKDFARAATMSRV
jgi:3-phenylpropionate/trans-cinnamate dioxygenase ferredoxin reductase subunit